MSVFYRKAYEAACRGDIPPQLTDRHFEDWKSLDEALRWLPTDEQRADAVYGDWLIQLSSPGWTQLLTVKKLLIGNGALAANYLAELAQNANDAAEGEEAEVRIVIRDEWLVFTNNGRKVTPDNLIGLCRFFKHVDPDTPVAQVIGQFGVGFKSSFRIADEVFVHSWDKESGFFFRLPISTEERPNSWPEPSVQQRVLDQLRGVDQIIADHAIANANSGFCTPESSSMIPHAAEEILTPLRHPTRGTAFCFHLHPAGLKEVNARIQGQREELAELCPLFLPYLRKVQIGPNELQMTEGRYLIADGIEGKVRASRITLTTHSPEAQTASHSKFWRLDGVADGDLWQVAIHADSEFKISSGRTLDEGVTLRNGAAYAFFPLNDVVWPFRFHLHINLQPNLARGDWNDGLQPQVHDQLKRAVSGMLEWLEYFKAKHHSGWRVEQLVESGGRIDGSWASFTFNQIIQEIRSVPLLKTLWGSYRTSMEARTVRLVSSNAASRNWIEFCGKLEGLDDEYPLVHAQEESDLGVPELPANRLKEFFLRASEQGGENSDFWRAFVGAAFSAESLEPDDLLAICGNVPVEKSDGSNVKLRELLFQPAGGSLTNEWHEQFKVLTNWLRDEQRGQLSLGGRELREQLKKLSNPVFNPAWADVGGALATQDDWNQSGQGELFWKIERNPCPAVLRSTVIQSIRVKNRSGVWNLIADIWLLDVSVPRCFHGVLKSWEHGDAIDHRQLSQTRDKLKAWDLWEAYEKAVEGKLAQGLGKKLGRELVKHSEPQLGIIRVRGPFEEFLDGQHDSSRNNLPTRWQAVVKEAEKEAMKALLQVRNGELRASKLVAISGIDAGLREVISFWGEYASCPPWLTDNALAKLIQAGLWNPGQYLVLTAEGLTELKRRELAKSLLANYHKWSNRDLTQDELKALQRLCESEPPTLRGNWSIGFSIQRNELVRNLLNPDPIVPTANGGDPNAKLLKLPSVRWHNVQQLPEQLRTISAIADAAIQVSKLRLSVEMPGAMIPVSREEIDPELLLDPMLKEFDHAAGGQFAAVTQSFDLEWRKDDQLVAELRKAPFAFVQGQVVTSRVLQPADESQYNLVLAYYGSANREDVEFHSAYNDQTKRRSEIYNQFRSRIVKNAKKQNVEEAGYKIEHILRELLQNAESAYVSKNASLPVMCDFTVVLQSSAAGEGWKFACRHHGRAFNEPDQNGPRNDIERIVSTPSENAPFTENELGRFNRGFKAVFLVCEAVTIRSGRFRFSVRDLLLVHPPPPVPPLAASADFTEFSFICSRDKAFRLTGLSASDEVQNQRKLPLFSHSSFVFLQKVTQVRIQLGSWLWQWSIKRDVEEFGWGVTEINQSFPASAQRFLVFFGERISFGEGYGDRRFSVAVKIDERSIPVDLDRDSSKVHLTFPTEEPFPLGFLVNGDFVTDAGRQGIKIASKLNIQLIAAGYEAVLTRLSYEVENRWNKAKWLAWAKILRLRDAKKDMVQRFPAHSEQLLSLVDRAERLLFDYVPHGDTVIRIAMLEFPSKLLRRIATWFSASWGLRTCAWIDPDIEGQLPHDSRPSTMDVSLDDFIAGIADDNPVRFRIESDLRSKMVQELKLDAIEKRELDRALQRLKSVVFVQINPLQTWDEIVEPKTVTWFWDWWQGHAHLSGEYTLDGLNLTLVCPRAGSTREELIENLRQPSTEVGKSSWYRLLGLACLMSAAYGNLSRLRKFWISELESRQFWEETGGRDYSEATKHLFGNLIDRKSRNLQASGENAEYWRHVFYDIRKVHELVWQREFADTVLQLAADPSRSGGLLDFLRSGQLPGQQSWSGVLGQSAGSPLFFVVRELRRLEIITNSELDRRAFFPCAPVRRAARQIGWIQPQLARRSDFESLAEVSECIYRKISEDTEMAAKFMPGYYDIPLLHFGLTQ